MIGTEATSLVGVSSLHRSDCIPILNLWRKHDGPPPSLSPLLDSIGDRVDEWWIARTKPRMEKAFAWDLHDQGIAYYLPLKPKLKKYPSGERRRLMVPPDALRGYVFVNGFSLDVYSPEVRIRVWRTQPIRNQKRFIQNATTLADEILKQGEEFERAVQLKEKTRCRVIRGVYEGRFGYVVRDTRAFVELDLEGGNFSVEVDRDDVEVDREEA